LKLLFKLLIVFGFIVTSLSAKTDIAKELGNIIANSLYNLDNDQAKVLLKPFLEQNNNVRAVKIIDATDNSIFLQLYIDDDQTIYDKDIPKDILKLSKLSSNIVYDDENIGRVTIFYKSKDILNLTKEEKDWIKNNTVKVGVEKWIPIIFSKDGKSIDGITGDFTKQIVQKTGLKIEVVSKQWDILLKEFKAGKIDVLPASYHTKNREKYGVFSTPYFKIKNYLYVKTTNDKIHSFKDLNGKKLAVVRDTGTIDEIKKRFPKIHLVLTDDLDQSINKVLNGEADALYEGQIAVEQKIADELISGLKSIPQNSFKADAIHYFISKDKQILKSIIDKALQSITPKEKAQILDKWLSENTSVELSDSELVWLDRGIEIKYAFDPNWRPIEWADEVKEHKGVVADILKLINQKSGIIFKPIYSKSWEEVVQSVKNAKADAHCDGDEGTKKYLNYSKPILITPYVFVSRLDDDYLEGFKNLKSKKIGVFKNSTIHHILQKEKPELKLILFTDDKDGFEMLKNNKLDVAIFSAMSAKYYMHHFGYKKDLKIAYKTAYDLKLKIAIRKELGQIPISIINKSLDTISDKELTDIIDKWTYTKVQTKMNWWLIAQIGGVVFLIILFILWNNRRLNLMVQEKTKDIEKQKLELSKLSKSLEIKVKERTKELDSERRLMNSIMNSQEDIVASSDGKRLITINDSFKKFYKVKTIEEYEKRYGPCICDSFEKDVSDEYLKKDMNGIPWVQYVQEHPDKKFKVIIKKDEKDHIFAISLDSFIFEGQKFITVVLNDITPLEEAKKEIEIIHKHTKDSIEYASLIQGALIPKDGAMSPFFKDHFVFWEPKDTVGGDIWLFNELRHKDECLLLFIDCTGHGVPGAFVTMIVKSIEREIVAKLKKHPELDISPAIIMSYFNKTMKKLLRQESPDSISNAGFDGGIIYYNRRTQILKFAGAETPLFYMTADGEFKTIKGNRYSVGYKKCDMDYNYKESVIEVTKGMKFYCTTDGYLDQNGGEKGFPFGKKRFGNIIKEHYTKPMSEQKTIFIDEMHKYESAILNNDRNDDMTVIAFEIGAKSEYHEDKIVEIFKYEGVMTQNVIATAMDNIETKIENMNLIGTISTITIEYCQNMMNYSKNEEEGSRQIVPAGEIEVQLINDEYYEVIARNIVSLDDKQKIEPKLIEIQSLDKAGIKKRYRELRKSGQNTHEKGGGIGMYEIAKVSDEIIYEFKPINADKFYFMMGSIVRPKKRK